MFFRIAILISMMLSASCHDAVEPVAVAVAAAESQPRIDSQLIMLSGTVRVFGREEVSLSGVTVCEDSTLSCVTSDGSGDFEMFVPAGTDLLLVAARNDLFTSLIPVRARQGAALVVQVVPRLAGEAFAELADGELQDETGMIFVSVEDDAGFGVRDAWLTIRDFAAWGPIYTEEGIVPALALKRTGAPGFGAYLELPQGPEEVGVGAPGRLCTSQQWTPTEEGLYRLPVRGSAITWLTVECL